MGDQRESGGDMSNVKKIQEIIELEIAASTWGIPTSPEKLAAAILSHLKVCKYRLREDDWEWKCRDGIVHGAKSVLGSDGEWGYIFEQKPCPNCTHGIQVVDK